MAQNECTPFRVMLADNDDSFRRTLAESLKSRFPSIVLDEAADGSEVMEKVKSLLPQLVFVDIRLPGLDGLELTRQIKALDPEIQVVILTSHDFTEAREAARIRGAYGLLSKASFIPHQVHDMVEELWTKWKESFFSYARSQNVSHGLQTLKADNLR